MADGKPLPAGSYQVRLTGQSAQPTVAGQREDLNRWVEFVRGGEVRGREVVTIIPAAEMKDLHSGPGGPRPGPNASRVEMLKGNDYPDRHDVELLVVQVHVGLHDHVFPEQVLEVPEHAPLLFLQRARDVRVDAEQNAGPSMSRPPSAPRQDLVADRRARLDGPVPRTVRDMARSGPLEALLHALARDDHEAEVLTPAASSTARGPCATPAPPPGTPSGGSSSPPCR
jgi:hypothetical protein